MNSSLRYGQCLGCRQVRLGIKKDRITIEGTPMTLYVSYQSNQEFVLDLQKKLPVWFDDENQIQFHLSSEMLGLREGKKLFIQRINVYVPVHHLFKEQTGCKGHSAFLDRIYQE